MNDWTPDVVARLNDPRPPANGKSALLRVLGAIEDRQGIHDRFMPDLVNDIAEGLAALGYDIAATPDHTVGGEERLDVERLFAAMLAAWPTHAEGSGGTGDTPTSSWTVADPAFPSETLAEHIAEEYSRATPRPR